MKFSHVRYFEMFHFPQPSYDSRRVDQRQSSNYYMPPSQLHWSKPNATKLHFAICFTKPNLFLQFSSIFFLFSRKSNWIQEIPMTLCCQQAIGCNSFFVCIFQKDIKYFRSLRICSEFEMNSKWIFAFLAMTFQMESTGREHRTCDVPKQKWQFEPRTEQFLLISFNRYWRRTTHSMLMWD